MMPQRVVLGLTKQIWAILEAAGPMLRFRKLNGILGAIEMQVEDSRYEPRAVVHLCEALVASAAAHDLPEHAARRIEEIAAEIVRRVERQR